MPGLPNGTDREIIFHIHSRKPSLARTWKPSSEIWMMRTYSNHRQLFLEAPTNRGMKPEQKMQISQSLASRSTRNTCRKKCCVSGKAMSIYSDWLYQDPSFPVERRSTILDKKDSYFSQQDSPGAFDPIYKNSIYTNFVNIPVQSVTRDRPAF